jgi:hypothetical protein
MSETGRCRVHVPEGATPKDGPSARRRHGYRDHLRDGRHSENSILIDYMTESPNVSGDDRSAILILTLFASPNGDRLFFIQMAKNREFSRPNREFKFRSCFGPAFGSVTNQDFCCGLSFEKAQLHFLYYNFVRIHQTLKMSPAMAAGLCRLWVRSVDSPMSALCPLMLQERRRKMG